VEVFDPASTREVCFKLFFLHLGTNHIENTISIAIAQQYLDGCIKTGVSPPTEEQRYYTLQFSKQIIPTERPPLVSEVSANFCGERGVAWSAQRIPKAVNLGFLKPELLIYTHEAEWTPFQTHYYSENLAAPRIEPRICSHELLTTRSQRR
jgi:hypothetical protein